ncbi:MAG: indole-3-glycerol phosphate synthase TrpC [Candidatus Bipolaricaulia bacterium]
MILDEIVSHKGGEIADRKLRAPIAELMRQAESQPAPVDIAEALGGEGVALIAEIKRASPSKGALAPNLQAETLAKIYAENGASAISVLTDERFFSGTLADLSAAKRAVASSGRSLPILRKDFLLDRYQVVEARAAGADAVLLIVRILSDDDLHELYAEVSRWKMTALVEVHDETEIERALSLNPTVVGINTRDLSDFSIDLDVFGRLRTRLPDSVIAVAESGIDSAADVARVGKMGADAVLVGGALVQAPDTAKKVRELVSGGMK